MVDIYSKPRKNLRIFSAISSAENSTKIITVSEFSKSEIVHKMRIKSQKISVIYPGITVKKTNIKNRTYTVSKPYLLHLGGSRLNKNTERVIKAYRFSQFRNDFNLVIVGRSNTVFSDVEIEQYFKEGVIFTGPVSEQRLIEFYQNATGLLYPSLYEGFGLPILEAMSLGLPVITSNRTSMPEVAGEAALYVNPKDVFSIRSAMEKLVKEKAIREPLKRKGLQQSKKFDWKTAAQKTILAYEEAAKKKT